ncbi:MAG TPA: DUF3810 domain-containing protein [Pyrinomonadaceae bacterium]
MTLLGVLLQGLAALAPWSTERFYARLLYPRLLAALCSFSRIFSFSTGEVLVYILLGVALFLSGRFCAQTFLGRGDKIRLIRAGFRFVAWVVTAVLWSFLITFGFNYQRPLLFELLGYEKKTAEARELEAIGAEIVRGVNSNYLKAHSEERAIPGADEVKALLKESFDTTTDLTLLPRGEFARPKPVYASGLLTRLGISGIYFPYTGEPNYNADAPDFQQPFSLAHEMAHQRGVARESEANFVAYLVCVNSRDPFVRYSGYRGGLGVLAELYRVEPEKARELAKQLGPGFREDSRRAALFWARAAGAAGALSQRFNDLYLRANRIKSGVNDYEGSTALIIGYYLQRASRAKDTPTP